MNALIQLNIGLNLIYVYWIGNTNTLIILLTYQITNLSKIILVFDYIELIIKLLFVLSFFSFILNSQKGMTFGLYFMYLDSDYYEWPPSTKRNINRFCAHYLCSNFSGTQKDILLYKKNFNLVGKVHQNDFYFIFKWISLPLFFHSKPWGISVIK